MRFEKYGYAVEVDIETKNLTYQTNMEIMEEVIS